MMETAAKSGADAVVFDLEDAVRPENKARARETLVDVLSAVAFGPTEVSTRVNGLATDEWAADFDAAVEAGVDTVSLPMVESPAQVERAVDELRDRTDTPPEVVVLLESPQGLFRGREIAEVCATLPEVTALTFGIGDYARATGGVPTSERIREFLSHRVVAYAAIGGLQAISSVYPDVGDDAGLRRVAERALELGFVGQSVIHPTQVPVVNEVFTPSEAIVTRMRALVAAYDDADSGALVHDGEFLDEALVERYRRLLARAEAISEK